MARHLTVEPGDVAGAAPAPGPSLRPWARGWGAPLWAHAAALGVVLLALVPVIGTGASFSADEGAAIIQARHLSRGEGWFVDHPAVTVDPTGRAYPLELSTKGPKGTAPFAKHPLYALLLAAADRVGGVTAMVLFSLVGTVAAATLAGALAVHLRPSLARPSLWIVGLASPLLFDGYLVIAHTVGAAAAVGAVLCAVRVVDGRRPWRAVFGVAACTAVAVLLRNEAVFVALGLGGGMAVVAARRRLRAVAAAAAASFFTAGVAHVGEQLWVGHIVGGSAASLGAIDSRGGYLSGRIASLALTWFRPSYGAGTRADLALVLMVGAVVLGAFAVRRHPEDRSAVVIVASVAAVAAVVAVATHPTNLVPGLVVAFPLVGAGLVAVRRSTLASVAARLCLVTFTAFALGVIATQYTTGGSGEWGGRYFAIGLPVVVPVLLLAVAEAKARLDPGSGRLAAGSLVVCSMSMAVMGVGSLRDTHAHTARLLATVDHAGQAVAATTTDRPVMLATSGAVPRLAWAMFDRQRWLLSQPEDLGALVGRLRAARVTRAVLVTNHLGRDRAGLDPWALALSRAGRPDGSGWQVVTLDLG